VFSYHNKSAAIFCNKVEACVLQILFGEKLQKLLLTPRLHEKAKIGLIAQNWTER
jgi:hypothetical protein